MTKGLKPLSLIAVVLVVIGSAGCGSKNATNSNPGPAENPGMGSQSIFADVIINGSDLSPGSFTTNYTALLLNLFNAPITNAAVSFTHMTLGTIVLTHDALFPGTYRASTNGYQTGRYNLSIRRGADSISGAYVSALEIHTITLPAPNDTLAMGSSFDVNWTRSYRADTAEVETRDYGPQPTADDGAFTVPTNPTARNDQRIRVKRFHTLLLAGGRPGSQIRAIIRNSVEPIVVE